MIKKPSMILGMVILFLFASGISEAQVNKYLNIPANAFRPMNDVVDFECDEISANAENTGVIDYVEFYAPVQLPDGAKYKKIYLRCYDFNGSYNVQIYLYRVSIYDGHTDLVYYAGTSFAPGWVTISDTSIGYIGSRIVKTKKWSYTAIIRVHSAGDSSLQWGNFKILYEQ